MIQSSGDVLPLILDARTGSSPGCMIESQEAYSDFKSSDKYRPLPSIKWV